MCRGLERAAQPVYNHTMRVSTVGGGITVPAALCCTHLRLNSLYALANSPVGSSFCKRRKAPNDKLRTNYDSNLIIASHPCQAGHFAFRGRGGFTLEYPAIVLYAVFDICCTVINGCLRSDHALISLCPVCGVHWGRCALVHFLARMCCDV